MKLPKSFLKMLENKYVLYFVLFLAVTNLLGYMILGNINAVIFFILVGFLTSNFTQNMIVVLSIPLILTSILMVGKKVKEGFSTSGGSGEVKPPTLLEINENIKKVQDELTTLQQNKSPSDADKTKMEDLQKKLDNLTNIKKTMEKSEVVPPAAQSPSTGDVEPQKPEQMTTMYKKNNRIDYASTIEDAYDDLDKILGGDGIKRLTDDTQKLMQQQLQLADAMKSMTPLMEQAKSLLNGFDMKGLNGLIGGLGGLGKTSGLLQGSDITNTN